MMKDLFKLKTAKSVNGKSIDLYLYESEKNNPLNILFVGVTHGEEPQGGFLISEFLEEIRRNKPSFKNHLYFLPCLNPDGKAVNKRGNANDVDLNRNFRTENWIETVFEDGLISGTCPQSEPETCFLTQIIEDYNFDVILSIHAPFRVVNFDGPAKKIAEEISKITNYPVQEDLGYPTPGSFGTFCGKEKNIPVITLELPDNETDENLWLQNQKVFYYLADLDTL
ncbi:MAG: DUF2817 domain-containing protein [Candidatus Gastranaerophilales bacterium]|nr:DUF2817 domain-containing protein [Candidatus Gastranaerophilales bacterium]